MRPLIMTVALACIAAPSHSAEASLDEYMNMNQRGQNDVILEVVKELLAEAESNDVNRAICITEVFNARIKDGMKRYNALRGTLSDAANKKIDKSAK